MNDRAKSISANKKSGQKNIIEEKNEKERRNPFNKK